MIENKITLTPAFYRRLKRSYDTALKNNANAFTLDGNEFLTAYAKYLLQYCEMLGVNEK